MIWRVDGKRRPISWVTLGLMAVVAWIPIAGLQSVLGQALLSNRLAYILMAILFFLLWIPVFRWHGRGAARSTLLGSARFGGCAEVAALKSNKGALLIGRSAKSGKLLRYGGLAHLITIARHDRARAWVPSCPIC